MCNVSRSLVLCVMFLALQNITHKTKDLSNITHNTKDLQNITHKTKDLQTLHICFIDL
jgi:hypothetical protein